jgi:gluconokinase
VSLPQSIIVMGVSGVGKTTVGSKLANKLTYTFIDADDYHSPENKKKMAAGIGLTDNDRQPWLRKLNEVLRDFRAKGTPAVMACSALRQNYRDTIGEGVNPTWVYLKAPAAKIHDRLVERHGHYATASLLNSQLETLEEPKDAITVDAGQTPDKVVQDVLAKLNKG